MKTKDVRPWWWWMNPWLYIRRRDRAYDDALDTLYELCLDVKYPKDPGRGCEQLRDRTRQGTTPRMTNTPAR